MQGHRQPTESVDHESYYERERPLFTTKMQCGKVWKNFNQFMIDSKIYETMNDVTKYLMSNPVLLAACIAVILVVAIPLLLFILFVIVNVAFAFTSFIIIEVTVLTMGATVLCCMLFFVISTITVMGLCLALSYYIAHYITSIIKNIKIAGN